MKCWAVAIGSGAAGWGVLLGAAGLLPRVPWWWIEYALLLAAMVGVVWCQTGVFQDIERMLDAVPKAKRARWERVACVSMVLWWLPVIMVFMGRVG